MFVRPRVSPRQGPDEEEENLLAEIIKKYDRSGSGTLEASEVEQFLREAGGVPPTADELRWVIHMATPRKWQEQLRAEKREVELRIDDLRGAARAWSCYLQKSAVIKTIFNMYDKDGNQELDKEELADFIRDYLHKTRLEQTALPSGRQSDPHPPSDERVAQMVAKVLEVCDTNADGKIQRPEMVQALVVVQNLAEHQTVEVTEAAFGAETTTLVIKMCVSLRGPRRPRAAGWRGPPSGGSGQEIPWENARELFETAVRNSKSDLSPGEGGVQWCVLRHGGTAVLGCAGVWSNRCMCMCRCGCQAAGACHRRGREDHGDGKLASACLRASRERTSSGETLNSPRWRLKQSRASRRQACAEAPANAAEQVHAFAAEAEAGSRTGKAPFSNFRISVLINSGEGAGRVTETVAPPQPHTSPSQTQTDSRHGRTHTLALAHKRL